MIHGSRKSRILSGISANIFGQFVTVCVQLAGVPLLLHYWGVQYYGEWLLLFSIPAYLGLSDLGLGTVATTEMSLSVARQDYERAGRIFCGAFGFMSAFGLLVCSAFAVAAWLLPFHRWLHLKQISPSELQWSLTLLAGYIFFAIVLTLQLGAYRSTGRYARGQVISNTFRLLEFSALLAAVAGGGNAVAAAAAFLSVRTVYAGVIWYDLRKQAAWLRWEKLSWEWPVVQSLLPPSLSMMTVYMGQTVVTQGLVTLTGVALGAASVVLFSTVRTLCNFAKQLIGIVNLSVFSEYALSVGSHDMGATRRLHTRAVQANIGLTFTSVAGLKIAGAFILNFWTDGKIAAEEPFFTLYLGYILVNSFWLGSWNMLLGCNRHQSITRYYIFLSFTALAIIYSWLGDFGLGLVPLVLMVSDAILTLIILRKSLEVLQQPLSEFIRQALRWPVLKKI